MRRVALAAAVLAALVVVGAPAAAPPSVSASCSPDPSDCSAWHNANVTVTWTVTGAVNTCPSVTITFDTGGSAVSCSATNADGSVTATVNVRRDATPPSVTGGAPARGPDGGGWYRSPVDVTFTGQDSTSGIAGCTSATYGGPDSASATVSGSCTDRAGNVSGSASFSLKYDASGPSIDASAARGPDGDGWYRSPVSFSASGSDGGSGLAGCSGASYGGPDTSSTSVTVSCSDNAGNSSSRSIELRYDATPPEVTGAALDRGPDSGEWYTRPVNVAFAGADAMSGLAGCTTQPYGGPDRDPVTVTGTCRDKAGNTSAAKPFTFRYDATPPKLTKAEVKKGDRFVTLSWAATGGAASSQIARSDGKSEPTVVYQGSGSTFTDRGVQNGVKYTYTLAVADAAGNAERRRLVALPRPALYRPERGARLRGPITFAWEKVPKATYYNFQLYRRVGARWVKVMTTWPGRPWLRVQRRWNVGGFRDRLTPARYRWYVFPGFQKRIQRRYGKLLGSSEFVVRR